MASQPEIRQNALTTGLANPPSHQPLLFLLPGLGGDQKLLKNIGQVVHIHYLDWTDLIQESSGFEALFIHVKSQIDARLPTGPVHLAGFSVGGPLAYACALAFQAEGREVASMAILDASASDAPVPVPFRVRLRDRALQFASFNVPAGVASIVGKAMARQPARPLLHRLRPYRNVALPFGYQHQLHLKVTMQMLLPMFWPWWIELTRTAPPVTAPTYVFRSQDHAPSEPEDLGWSRYCSHVKVVRVPGSHSGMLSPKVNGPLSAQLLNFAGIKTPSK
jgi:thioesterase domain-containing protein